MFSLYHRFPVPGFVAAEEPQGRAGGIEREEHSDLGPGAKPGRSSLRWWTLLPWIRSTSGRPSAGLSSRGAATARATWTAEARSSLIRAVNDWRREGSTVNLSGRAPSMRAYWPPVLDAIGARPLRVLSAGDVRSALSQLATRYLQITGKSLERAIRHAEAVDLVGVM
jgi:hypothetical protein